MGLYSIACCQTLLIEIHIIILQLCAQTYLELERFIVASPVKRRLRLVPAKPTDEAETISETLILSDFDKTLTDCDAGQPLPSQQGLLFSRGDAVQMYPNKAADIGQKAGYG